jgi:hypothetical protein
MKGMKERKNVNEGRKYERHDSQMNPKGLFPINLVH